GGRVLPVDAVEIEAPIAQVLNRAALAAGEEIREAQIGNRDRLGVRRSVGGDAVTCKGKIRRGQYRAFGIVNVHILNVRQIADDARGDDIALVLDGARVTAISHAK